MASLILLFIVLHAEKNKPIAAKRGFFSVDYQRLTMVCWFIGQFLDVHAIFIPPVARLPRKGLSRQGGYTDAWLPSAPALKRGGESFFFPARVFVSFIKHVFPEKNASCTDVTHLRYIYAIYTYIYIIYISIHVYIYIYVCVLDITTICSTQLSAV